jgi:hypothetical protein
MPYPVRFGERRGFIDISAEHEQDGKARQILLAEVKCFFDPKTITTDTYVAIGQYLMYRAMLSRLQIEAPLYLAISKAAYSVIVDEIVEAVLLEQRIKLVVIDFETEEIVSWIE